MESKETILKLYDNFIDDIYAMTPKNNVNLSKLVALEEELNKS